MRPPGDGDDPGPDQPYAAVLDRVAAGDPTALVALYDDFGEVVYRLAGQQLHNAEHARPVTEAVFLEARWLSALPRRDPRGVLCWLLAITHRRIHDRNRERDTGDDTPAAPARLLDYDDVIHREFSALLLRS